MEVFTPEVGVAVNVDVAAEVGVWDGVRVAVGVSVTAGVFVEVAVTAEVADEVAVLVGLLPPVSMISCGAFDPDSRLAKLISVALAPVSARLKVPLPVT